MKRLLANIVVGFLALYLATILVPGVSVAGSFEEQIKLLFFAGIVLGCLNFFIKPIINFIAFPLRLLTLGLFSLIINMAMVWLIDVLFVDLTIPGLAALFWTSLIVWLMSWAVPQKRAKKD